jgi:hypothetical protein
MDEESAREALLALVLLHQEVATTVALNGQFA